MNINPCTSHTNEGDIQIDQLEPLGTLLGCAGKPLSQQILQKAISSTECCACFRAHARTLCGCLCLGQQQTADSVAEGALIDRPYQGLSTFAASAERDVRARESRREQERAGALLPLPNRTSGTGFPDCVFPYLTWLEIVFHTVLEAFSFGLQGCHDETVSHKVSRVADSFTGAKTVDELERLIFVFLLLF